jgi:hypothetical protein
MLASSERQQRRTDWEKQKDAGWLRHGSKRAACARAAACTGHRAKLHLPQ